MKIRNLVVVLTLLLLLCACHSSQEQFSIPVYVNSEVVSDVNVCVNIDGDIYIKYSDIPKVFPEETIYMTFSDKEADILLSGWASTLGYTMHMDQSAVYLEKNDLISEAQPDVTFTPNQTAVKVYVNGFLINTSDVYMEENTVKLQSDGALYNIFPEAKSMANIGNIIDEPLETWASYLGYSYLQKGIRVYLNNNDQKPVEVVLEDILLDFPDQQPLLISNRILVPVRAFTETLGYQLDYSNGQTTITNGEHIIIFWNNSTTYIIDNVEKVMDVPPQIVNDRTLVPIRFISEAFNYNVNFNSNEIINTVTLTNKT